MNVDQAVIVCGGKGSRIEPHFPGLAKSCIPINGKKFITYQINWLIAGGISNIHLCLGFRSHQVISAIVLFQKENPGILSFTTSFDNPLQGVGGAVKNAINKNSESFVFMYGDVLPRFSCSYIVSEYKGFPIFSATLKKNSAERPNLKVEHDSKRVVDYQASGSTHIEAGCMIFPSSITECIPKGVQFDESELYPVIIDKMECSAMECEASFEIGSMGGIAKMKAEL